jgi:hypothetical protein
LISILNRNVRNSVTRKCTSTNFLGWCRNKNRSKSWTLGKCKSPNSSEFWPWFKT